MGFRVWWVMVVEVWGSGGVEVWVVEVRGGQGFGGS